MISQILETRSERQCSKKYAFGIRAVTSKIGKNVYLAPVFILIYIFWQIQQGRGQDIIRRCKKTRYTIFLKIKESMKSQRSAELLRYRYKCYLDAYIDKSPWTQEEKEQLYSLYAELKNAKLVKEKMNSKRSLRHIHSQLQGLKKKIK